MWVLYAIASAVLWGANYLIYEKILGKISVSSLYLIDLSITAVIYLLISTLSGAFNKDVGTILQSKSLQYLVLWSIITSVLANSFIALSIQAKNATLASMIEITYPIFIILLGYLLFKENNLSSSVIVGGGFIFIGISVIYAFNK